MRPVSLAHRFKPLRDDTLSPDTSRTPLDTRPTILDRGCGHVERLGRRELGVKPSSATHKQFDRQRIRRQCSPAISSNGRIVSNAEMSQRSGNTTSPIASTYDGGRPDERKPSLIPALTVVWALAEPHRVGEVALFPGNGRYHLGRDDEADQAVLVRLRPGRTERTGPLAGDHLSRRQICIDVSNNEIVVENVGRLRMLINGEEKKHAALAVGDVVALHKHSGFVLSMRPAALPKLTADYPPCAFGEADRFGIVGESHAAWELREQLARFARFDEHVLVLGESGTGKELAARALWSLSSRARGPFVDRSAATLPSELVAAEVFGNRKDFPNPGMPDSEGLLGAARTGVLFLDEIGEISQPMQAAFLRVLDRGASYQRLGDPKPRHADVRFVCATNRAPAELKHDFAARLSLRIELPPLDARREDIPLIARQLVLEAAAHSPEAAERFVRRSGPRPEVNFDPALLTQFLQMDCPTNIRDLVLAIREAMTATPDDRLRSVTKNARARTTQAPPPDPNDAAPDEKARLRAELERHHWHVTRAAEALGLTRYALARAIKKYGLRATP